MSEHGTRFRYMSGCHCAKCRSAMAAHRLAYEHARGVVAMVDPQPSRDYIHWLRAHGVGETSLVAASGLSRSAINSIACGRRQRIKATSAERILGVSRREMVSKAFVPSWPFRLMVSYINKSGVADAEIASALRIRPDSFRQIVRREQVQRRNIDRMRTIYTYLAQQGRVPAKVLDEIA